MYNVLPTLVALGQGYTKDYIGVFFYLWATLPEINILYLIYSDTTVNASQ